MNTCVPSQAKELTKGLDISRSL